MHENLLFATYDMDTILISHKNVQICFCDSENHPPHAVASSKSNMQLDADRRRYPQSGRSGLNFCINKGTDTEGADTEPPAVGADTEPPAVGADKEPPAVGADIEPPEVVAGATPINLGGDEQPPSDDDETVYLMILTFMEGMNWLLEFVESNKPDLDSRLASSRKKEVGITKAQKVRSQKQLIKLQASATVRQTMFRNNITKV
jgi:hypothetical protein